jgi:hypothetical protein
MNAPGLLDLVEAILKRPGDLAALIRDHGRAGEVVPRFLAIALSGFTLFALAVGIVLDASPVEAPWLPAVSWADGSLLEFILAEDIGLVAACGICLPSFYFFGLLSGIRITMVQVAAFAVECLAVSAVVLTGLLPVWVALALGLATFGAPVAALEGALLLGLCLPFVAGLFGVKSLFDGFLGLTDTLDEERRASRGCFLRRLVFAWAACYVAVTPVMVYTLLDSFLGVSIPFASAAGTGT